MSRPEVTAITESQESNAPIEIPIRAHTDIVAARQRGKMLAVGLGFSPSDAIVVATAISELARNIVLYANPGEIILNAVTHDDRSAVIITARDQGMGIADLSRAVQDSSSTAGHSGLGLAAVRRLMDEFDIVSEAGKGTVVTATKWLRGSGAARTATSPWPSSTPWGTGDPSLDSRGSGERERDRVEGTFARSQKARTLSPSSAPGPGRFDAAQ